MCVFLCVCECVCVCVCVCIYTHSIFPVLYDCRILQYEPVEKNQRKLFLFCLSHCISYKIVMNAH